MFKPGDKVVCVDARCLESLTEGVTYTILDVHGEHVDVNAENGEGWHAARFKLAEDDKILSTFEQQVEQAERAYREVMDLAIKAVQLAKANLKAYKESNNG